MSYVVSDELSSHRSVTKNGVKLMIINGDFLKLKNYLRKSNCNKAYNQALQWKSTTELPGRPSNYMILS